MFDNNNQCFDKVFNYLRNYDNGFYGEYLDTSTAYNFYNRFESLEKSAKDEYEYLFNNYINSFQPKIDKFIYYLFTYNDKSFFEKQLCLDKNLPFTYNDLNLFRNAFLNTFPCPLLRAFQLFLDHDSNYLTCDMYDLDLLSKKLGMYYNLDNLILDYKQYKKCFRKKVIDEDFTAEQVWDDFNNFSDFDNHFLKHIVMGRYGELFAYNHLLSIGENVEWISRDYGDGYGYDLLVRSFEPDKLRGSLIEVKTTTKDIDFQPNILTSNETFVYNKCIQDDSLYDYYLFVYQVTERNNKLFMEDDPIVISYDRNRKCLKDDSNNLLSTIINSDQRMGYIQENCIKTYVKK